MFSLLSILLQFSCNNTLGKAEDESDLKLEYFTVSSISHDSLTVTWGCSGDTIGYMGIGKPDIKNYQFSLYNAKTHRMTFKNLDNDVNYSYIVSCNQKTGATSPIQTVRTQKINIPYVNITFPSSGNNPTNVTIPSTITMPPPPPSEPTQATMNRGIWILGGSSGGTPIGQVDLFDPVNNIWYPSVTTIPTPRSNAGIVSNNGKIYVMGGLIGTTIYNLVEEYNSATNTWRTMANMPVNLQGFITSSVGTDIYAIGGSTTAFMFSGTLPPFNLYRFSPSVGTIGTWVTIVSSTALFARSEMAGCSIDGLFFFFGGRYYLDGSAYATGDAYVTAANTTTTLGESNITQPRHGMATTCYRPIPSDPYPSDTKAMFMIGGSTLTDLSQPVTAINPSNVYNYYQPLTNTMSASPVFPISIYGAAAEISYVNRKIYVFGGSTTINIPTSAVYSTGLATPTAGPWVLETYNMPIARVGHSAVILSR